ncbi:uncharacterized protein B0P05DRAFT_553480 [Gilbertella persicaria]|uniref:Blue light receptor n=1 Tax=Rhizopus stolonifer TaxID=4846 RepID=A0A367IJS1_RHIST|nr:uncharacterized protein B0P05DRAFT_553480 [Gilbertella persicaria]KAI8066231.1 hypothetical protein B0P05DRAFT_553480 [Gilbertella persicaria]RCH77913.1 blue light receptor [Rhizopus stolonifer]
MQQSEYYSYILNNSKNLQQDNSNYYANLESSSGPSQAPLLEKETQLKGGTDFRRRKNWSERILVEITGLLHVLSPTGKILYCSESTHELTGYRPHELVGQALIDFLHVDDMDVFIRDFQMSFHTRSQIKTHYRFRKKDDTYVIFEVVGHPRSDFPGQPPQSFFGIAQPIPTKSGALIDTFLELKTENNWLKKRIDELSAKYGKVERNREETSSSGASTVLESNFIPNLLNVNSEEWMDTSDLDDYAYKEEHKIPTNPDQETMDALERKDKWKRRVREI